jgi:hypothetical protein
MADNVLIDRSASGFEFRRWAAGDEFRSLATMSVLQPDARGIYSSLPYVSPLPPFQYAAYLHSSLSLPPLNPRRHPPLLPLPPAAAAKGMKQAAQRRTGPRECKRKKPPRTPRLGEEPPSAQRRKPLERATPLPPAPAVHEALDDLERQVTMGFVEDLKHALALAPPPSSLPLPTFSLVRAAAAAAKAVPSCTV